MKYTFGEDAIDAAFGHVPQPLRDGLPVVVRKPSGHRAHLALTPGDVRTLCGVDAGLSDPDTRRYDLEDTRFARRRFPCRTCSKRADDHGIHFGLKATA